MARKDAVEYLYAQALLEMANTKKLSSITVTALIAQTGTARQTFYNHFDDINDLISFIPISFMEMFWRPLYFADTVREAYCYAAEHKGFFCQLPFHVGQNNFRDTFIEYYRKRLREEFLTEDLSDVDRTYRTIAIEQLVIGVTDTFLEWCRLQMTWPIDVLVKVQYDSAPAFIKEQQREMRVG